MSPLFPDLTGDAQAPDRPALRFGDRSLTYAELTAVTGALADRVKGAAGSPSGRPPRWRPPSPWWRHCGRAYPPSP